MLIAEMHYDFDVKIDKVASQSKASFNVAEKDWLLNEAQSVFIKRRFRGAFELDQKRIDDLKTLVINREPITPILLDTDVYELPLSSLAHKYLFFVSGLINVDLGSCEVKASMRHIQHDDLNYALRDPFNNSDSSEILFNFGRSSASNSASIYLYPGTLTLGEALIDYLKEPSKMSFGGYTYIDGATYPTKHCELPEHTHNEIVDIAVEIASGIIEHPEYVKLKTQKVFTQE